MKYVLTNLVLPVRNDYGSRFVLHTEGETLEEMLRNGLVTEFDRNGVEVSHCHVMECPLEVHEAATKMIERLYKS